MPSETRLLTVRLKSLKCIETDEGVDEPFIWAVGIAIGGDQLHEMKVPDHDEYFLQGAPGFWFSRGSHGNTGRRRYRRGDVGLIPSATGLQIHRFSPIPVQLLPNAFPAVFVLVLALFEEDSVTDDASEAGHLAFNALLTSEVTRFVNTIELKDLIDRGGARSLDTGVHIAEGIKAELESRFDAFKVRLVGPPIVNCDDEPEDSLIERVVTDAIIDYQTVFEDLGALLDPDDTIGSTVLVFTAVELMAAGRKIEFGARLDSSPCNDYGTYELSGELELSRRLIPVGVLPDARRLRIESVATAHSRRLRARYITHVGGRVNGEPWILDRYRAAMMVRNGERTFFTISRTGDETLVEAGQHERTGSLYLRSEPNRTEDDNLLYLPHLDFFIDD